MTENKFPGPKEIGTIKNQIFTKSQNNETTEISNVNVLFELFEGLTAKSKLPLFIKPINGIGGMHTFKLHKCNLDNEITHKIYNHTFSKNFIIQESLRQHELLSSLYSQSVNTLRVNTFKGSDGSIVIASALLRMGAGKLFVDNVTAGGLYVPLDLETGMLGKYAFTFFKNGGRSYLAHPDSGLVFESFRYPYLDEMKNLVIKAARLVPNKIVGWDVATTEDGPILIEGNHNPHLTMLQRACGGFKNHPVYSEAFKEYI